MQNMESCIDQFSASCSQLERILKDVAIPQTYKAPMLLPSIDPKSSLEPTAAALRTQAANDLTWNYVATTLTDEYNARHSNARSTKSRVRKIGNKSIKSIFPQNFLAD